jgi:hypothetical protein
MRLKLLASYCGHPQSDPARSWELVLKEDQARLCAQQTALMALGAREASAPIPQRIVGMLNGTMMEQGMAMLYLRGRCDAEAAKLVLELCERIKADGKHLAWTWEAVSSDQLMIDQIEGLEDGKGRIAALNAAMEAQKPKARTGSP